MGGYRQREAFRIVPKRVCCGMSSHGRPWLNLLSYTGKRAASVITGRTRLCADDYRRLASEPMIRHV